MNSLLNIGTRALLANQAALATTGHNIANANTVGYSRQTAVLQQVAGRYTGNGYSGQGVEVADIERAHSEFLTRQASLAQSIQAMDSTRAERLDALQDIFQGGVNGLGAAVNDTLNAFSDVASVPTDLTARNVVLTRADELATRFQDAHQRLSDLRSSVGSQLGESIRTVNALAAQIGSLNEQVARAQGVGHSPNDLLDQRDQALRELNNQVQASTVAANDGTLSVFIGNQALVLGATSAKVALATDADGGSRLSITRGTLTTTIDPATLGGGSVAGLLQFQNTDLVQVNDQLGRMALALGTELNAQHRLGVDLNGTAGRDLFKPIAIADATPLPGNGGNAVLRTTVVDASALVASSYAVAFDPTGGIDVRRLSDGRSSHFTGALPIQIDGLRFELDSGSAAAGDAFVIKPYADAAGAMQSALTSPRELAVASPVQARAASGNGGTLAVGSLAASRADPNLNATVTLTFTGSGTFDVNGSGTGNPTGVPYTAGQPIEYNGWSLNLRGVPAPGDSITIEATSPAFSRLNAGNASALLALRDKAVFDGAPMADGHAALMAQLGVRTQSAHYAADASTSIAAGLESERSSAAGVSLDEEAARLLQYQQAYQASAKMIQVAQNVFDTLLRGMN